MDTGVVSAQKILEQTGCKTRSEEEIVLILIFNGNQNFSLESTGKVSMKSETVRASAEHKPRYWYASENMEIMKPA